MAATGNAPLPRAAVLGILDELERIVKEAGDSPTGEHRRKWLRKARELNGSLRNCTRDDFSKILLLVSGGARDLRFAERDMDVNALLDHLVAEQAM